MDVTLYHWTHRRKLPSINSGGLLREYAETADKCLYAVGYVKLLDGLYHVARRHNWKPADMVCVRMTVPNSVDWFNRRKGFCRIVRDVPRSRLSIATMIPEPRPMCGSLPSRRCVGRLISVVPQQTQDRRGKRLHVSVSARVPWQPGIGR